MKTNYYTTYELNAAKKAIRQTAAANRKPESEIRRDIKKAIMAGVLNHTHGITMNWSDVLCKGEYPTPEEFVAWCSRQCRHSIE